MARLRTTRPMFFGQQGIIYLHTSTMTGHRAKLNAQALACSYQFSQKVEGEGLDINTAGHSLGKGVFSKTYTTMAQTIEELSSQSLVANSLLTGHLFIITACFSCGLLPSLCFTIGSLEHLISAIGIDYCQDILWALVYSWLENCSFIASSYQTDATVVRKSKAFPSLLKSLSKIMMMVISLNQSASCKAFTVGILMLALEIMFSLSISSPQARKAQKDKPVLETLYEVILHLYAKTNRRIGSLNIHT